MSVVEKRFWAKVKKTDHCWYWTACKTKGYGEFAIGNKKQVRAHRFSYELKYGSIPKGLQLDHLCRNTLCVKPGHLEAVSPKINTRRGKAPSASMGRRTHCNRGHKFSIQNTYIRKAGHGRSCRACDRLRSPRNR